jgi:hypothetical protein
MDNKGLISRSGSMGKDYEEYAQQQSVKSETSLDILEECLRVAYRTRKASLNVKGRRRDKRLEKKESSHIKTSRAVFENKNDDDDNSVFSSSPPRYKQNNSKTEPLIQATTNSTASKANPLESPESDNIAAVTFDNFKTEITQWWLTNTSKHNDEDYRSEYAEVLTEKYLCQKLDPLPGTLYVTKARKIVSSIIEEFATDGKLDFECEQHRIEKPGQQKINYKEYSTQLQRRVSSVTGKTTDESDLSSSSSNGNNKAKTKIASIPELTAEERNIQEREKIKKQYEEFMKLKKKDTAIDAKQQMEMETHLDDIRSLISSIRPSGA